ncbi:MAG: hypothetical protein QW343_04120 [Candidatus Norongarragalinales archaeon]
MRESKIDLDSIARGRTLLDLKREEEDFLSGGKNSGKRALGRELRRGAEFAGWFAVFAFAAFLFLSIPLVAQVLAGIAAAQSSIFLTLAGVQNTIEWRAGVPNVVSLNQGLTSFDAEIAELCWGKVEFAVLFGIIAASFDRTRKQRIFGFVTGFVFFALFFNPLRISLSLLWQNALVHDVLFRATLAASIVFYYFAWYVLTARVESRRREAEHCF